METTKHYNNSVILEFDPQKHAYLLNGEKVNGVTTVLQRLSKPALVYWAAKKAAEHMESTLIPGQALDEMQIKQLAKDSIWAHRNAKDGAADMGTWIHSYLEQFIQAEQRRKDEDLGK